MPTSEFVYAKALIPVYRSLYERAQAMLKRFNPCKVCDGVCERHRRGLGRNFCCSECVYLGPQGCQVEALQCSLWICRYDLIAKENERAFNSIMWSLMIEAEEFHLLYPRGSMEDSLQQACRYYIEHRDERGALMKKALEYKPKPVFFALPEASSAEMKRVFPYVYHDHVGRMDFTKPLKEGGLVTKYADKVEKEEEPILLTEEVKEEKPIHVAKSFWERYIKPL